MHRAARIHIVLSAEDKDRKNNCGDTGTEENVRVAITEGGSIRNIRNNIISQDLCKLSGWPGLCQRHAPCMHASIH